MDYAEFIERKKQRVETYGFEPIVRNAKLFDWQGRIVDWSVRRGRSAIFAGTGLGKTAIQLVWSENIVKHTGRPVIIFCPLGVRHQTKAESEHFGIGCDVRVVRDQSECGDGINICNYDRIDKIHGGHFAGVVLDESSILKGETSKTRAELGEMFSGARFKLCCTATPSPNDHTELGNHAEFLGVMKSSDMLNRFFFHDSGDTSKYVLMPSAVKPFWSWVASWAVAIGMPSDIGGDDTGYVLPELRTHRHIADQDEDETPVDSGFLFNTSGVSATTMHQEKRLTVRSRVLKAVEIYKSEPKRKTIIWCDTNEEQDMLEELLHGECASIRGSTSGDKKESLEESWRLGSVPILITKGSIFGAGMNWQHCSKMIFVGLNYSFETYYQSIRRCWRFGQSKPVDVHIVLADSEHAMHSAIARKECDFLAMRSGMVEAMRERTLEEFGLDSRKVDYAPKVPLVLPKRLQRAKAN